MFHICQLFLVAFLVRERVCFLVFAFNPDWRASAIRGAGQRWAYTAPLLFGFPFVPLVSLSARLPPALVISATQPSSQFGLSSPTQFLHLFWPGHLFHLPAPDLSICLCSRMLSDFLLFGHPICDAQMTFLTHILLHLLLALPTHMPGWFIYWSCIDWGGANWNEPFAHESLLKN